MLRQAAAIELGLIAPHAFASPEFQEVFSGNTRPASCGITLLHCSIRRDDSLIWAAQLIRLLAHPHVRHSRASYDLARDNFHHNLLAFPIDGERQPWLALEKPGTQLIYAHLR